MGAKEEKAKDTVIKSMGVTKKSLMKALTNGGFFYFIGDADGKAGALIVFDKKKDKDGKMTFRTGRGLLKDFKTGYGKPLYSQGEVTNTNGGTFNISKGNAKPAMLKKAFKKNPVLLKGLSAGVAGKLKSIKIKMASGGEEEEEATVDDAALKAWADTPEVMALIEDMGLDADELKELYAAEQAFQTYAESMPSEAMEDSELELRQGEIEAGCDELNAMQSELSKLDGDERAAAEDKMNQTRLELAMKCSHGPNPLASEDLTGEDLQFLTASITASIQLLLIRVGTVRKEMQKEGPANNEEAEGSRVEQGKRLFSELEAVTSLINMIRTPT